MDDASEPDIESILFIFQTDGEIIVSMDGNFGLVRKHSSGISAGTK